MTGIQNFLLAQLQQRGKWLKIFFATLAVFVAANIFVRPAHPHFVYDAYPGFFAVFGLGVGYAMVFVMKKIIQPLIVRKEDYYHDI